LSAGLSQRTPYGSISKAHDAPLGDHPLKACPQYAEAPPNMVGKRIISNASSFLFYQAIHLLFNQ
jgi:hypothetical protein